MSLPEDETERRALRAASRRRRIRALLIGVAVGGVILLLPNRLARTLHVSSDVMRLTLVVGFSLLTQVLPRWRFLEGGSDRHETPRLRWLRREKEHLAANRGLIFATIPLVLLLIGQILMLFAPDPAARTAADITPFFLIAVLGSLRWRLGDLSDEGIRERALVAAYRAFVVTFVAVIAAMVIDDWHPGLFRPTATIAVLIGTLSLQLSLWNSEPRLDPEDP